MDEKPFRLQKAQNSDIFSTCLPEDLTQVNKTPTPQKISQPGGTVAAEDGFTGAQPNSSQKVKQKSSQLAADSKLATNTAGKKKVTKLATKNLLSEFEKDDRLEPSEVDSTAGQSKPQQQNQQDEKTGYVGRQERRDAEQPPPPRKNNNDSGEQNFLRRNREKAVYHVLAGPSNNTEPQQVLPEITLSNQRKQSMVDLPQRHHDQTELINFANKKAAMIIESKTQRDENELRLGSPRRMSLVDQFSGADFFDGQPKLRVRFTEAVRKFNLELMKSTCQVMKGCKPWKAKQIADSVFELLNQILNHLHEKAKTESINQKRSNGESVGGRHQFARRISHHDSISSPHKSSLDETSYEMPVRVVKQVTTSVSTLKDILNYCFKMNSYLKPDCLKDFLVASLLMQSKINVIVLLAGTSGTGKSTLASLLGTRLGISTVLSSDSVRHVMRNFLKEEENPTLFCSTYEAGKMVSEEERQNASDNWITLKGYKKQCSLVTKELAKVIDSFYQRNQSLVVEGVHLTMSFLKEMMSKYPTCIPFVLYIKNKNKHGERFAVRAKHMTIDPRFNKYISNIQHIRTIQEYLLKKSEEILIPRIENHNVDRSVSFIQTIIMRCLHRTSEGELIYDPQQKRATGIHKVVQSIQKHQLSSKQAQSLIHMKVDRVKIVEKFLEDCNEKQEYDPDLERKLTQHRVSTSLQNFRIKNIWKCGEFQNAKGEEEDQRQIHRSDSIINVMPVLKESVCATEGTPEKTPETTPYYHLSKKEKKQIKRDLMEFAKKLQGQNKESLQRQNMIQTEEAQEAKICEGSQASSILNDHRNKVLGNNPKQTISAAVAADQLTTASTVPMLDNKESIGGSLQHQQVDSTTVTALQPTPLVQTTLNESTSAAVQFQQQPAPSLHHQLSPEGAGTEEQDEQEKKLIAKKLMSDKQKENELVLLREAQQRAEKHFEMEELQQMKQGLVESAMHTKKRNKSQEHAGGDVGGKSDDGIDSQGSLDVMAGDEDDQIRLQEVMDVVVAAKGTLKLASTAIPPKNDSKKLLENQKLRMGNIQQVSLLRVQEDGKSKGCGSSNGEPSGGNKQMMMQSTKKKFDYKLETAGSADNLIAVATQQKKEIGKSKFSTSNHHQGGGETEPEAKDSKQSKRMKVKVDKNTKQRQSSQQQEKNLTRESRKSLKLKKQDEESKKVARRGDQARHTIRQSVTGNRSVTSGSYNVHSTRGNAHSLSEKHQNVGASMSEKGGNDTVHHNHDNEDRDNSSSKDANQTNKLQKPSNEEAKSGNGVGDKKTIEEEDSEYSQTIGSLVSYTINYMEKRSLRGAGGQSSRHDEDRINEVDHSDSDDHSLLAEKEDSHSDIDTIEEEVDLSSEGTDHEDQLEQSDNNDTQKTPTAAQTPASAQASDLTLVKQTSASANVQILASGAAVAVQEQIQSQSQSQSQQLAAPISRNSVGGRGDTNHSRDAQ